MHRASRESLKTARERLQELGHSVDTATLSVIADELEAFAALLEREPTLRRALADSGVRGERRRELLDAVLSGKVSDQTLAVLGALVEGRWSSSADLVDAAEILTVDAHLHGAEREGHLADVEDELFRFSRIVLGSPELAGILGDRATGADRRRELVRSLLAGKADPITVRLVELAAAIGIGGRRFEASVERLVFLTAERRDREVAYVRVAAPMTDAQEARLSSRLAATYGRDISLKVQVDPSIIGGATVRVGDDLYDGSVKRRLENARATLAR
ncbi:MAG: F-type H+-transporting ATPase subunit delta [Actinomycetota bacterium]|jgi:F-type H+-transporting ATPase subunit delta|nr:synthase subunit delta [Cryptosporangiaceae bacterium]MDQ1678931.1 F-type H+-transporting ATPase subunit delta [Actinomycetota bacterium]